MQYDNVALNNSTLQHPVKRCCTNSRIIHAAEKSLPATSPINFNTRRSFINVEAKTYGFSTNPISMVSGTENTQIVAASKHVVKLKNSETKYWQDYWKLLKPAAIDRLPKPSTGTGLREHQNARTLRGMINAVSPC